MSERYCPDRMARINDALSMTLDAGGEITLT